jgi:hypothetical protein
VFKQGHETLLGNILSRRGILEHPAGETIHGIAMAGPKDVESAFVAAYSSRDLLLFRIHRSGLARSLERIRGAFPFFLAVEGYLRLGDAEEKLADRKAAREAYSKFLDLAPNDKRSEAIKKKLSKKS